MPKMNFVRYPEINAISHEIDSLTIRLEKVKKVMNEIEDRKKSFVVTLKNAQQKIKADFSKQLIDNKKKYEEELKRAHFFSVDLKRLKAGYRNKIIELNDACRYQVEQRRERQKMDSDKLQQSYEVCRAEETNIHTKVDALRIQLKERWASEKPKIKERRLGLKVKIIETRKKHAVVKRRANRETREAIQNLIKAFQKEHPYYRFLRLRIRLANRKDITKLDQHLYDLVVKINELKLMASRTPRTEKNNLTNVINEYRLNEAKPEAITFTEVRDRFVRSTGKILNSKYISAIRGAFFTIIPLIFILAFFVLIDGFFFSVDQYGFFSLFNLNSDQQEIIERFKTFGVLINDGISETLSIALLVALVWNLSRYYTDLDGFGVILVAVICMLIMEAKIIPMVKGEPLDTLETLGGRDTNGGTGWSTIFGKDQTLISLIVGLACPPLLAKFSSIPRLRIKLPNDSPAIIVKTFNSIIPSTLTILVFAALSFTVFELGTINEIKIFYNTGVSKLAEGHVRIYDVQDVVTISAIKVIGFSKNSLGNVMLLMLMEQIFWFFGIEPEPVVKAISDPIFLKNASELSNHVFTSEGMKAYLQPGGGAAFLAICLSIVVFSKRRDYKIVAWVSVAPAIFNIPTPIAFGLPLAFNPMFVIPTLLVSILLPVYVWLCVYAQPALQMTHSIFNSEIVQNSGKYASYNSLPFFILAGLAGQTGWAAVLFSFSSLLVATCLYTPFVILLNWTAKQEFLDAMIREKQREQLLQSQRII